VLQELSKQLGLGALLSELKDKAGGYDLVDHWQQGEFHHDVVLRVPNAAKLPGPVLVVATNCNGGVKEILCFDSVPARGALWRHRCPDNHEFDGELPPVLGEVRTIHWFDPCELLRPDARSEYREEARERQPGGGWRLKSEAAGPTCAAAAGSGAGSQQS
jgi:hypothetical protein